ncbi:MAG: type II secretion system ATPase GspE [Myxococcota bacterium]|jgi:general secretion pathway protein E|nr:type II secretion system ATPase GspE [Myxococcota bacterium]
MLGERVVGEILVRRGLLLPEKLEELLQQCEEREEELAEVVVRGRLLTEEEMQRAVAEELGIAFLATVDTTLVDWQLVERIPIGYAKRFLVLPVSETEEGVVVLLANPFDLSALDDLRLRLGREVIPALGPREMVLGAINRVYERRSGAEQVMDEVAEGSSTDYHTLEEEVTDLIDATDEAPIIRLVNSILFQAVKERASDIHFEPFERFLSVRFRVDGVLREIIKPPKQFQNHIISRVKVMAGLDIAEKRLPQDGRIRIKIAGKDIDIRVSTIPTSFGERSVLRLLERAAILLNLADIGFEPDRLEAMNRLIARPHGILLVTGPTGSGKTTTLYAALAKINRPDLNILTVEDPVEYQLQGIGQMQVNPKIDLTFASGLRHFLRQDPDVIMVGEIRDAETAEIAIQASLTGHLVLSTIHTNDAAGAFTRLLDMGIEPFLVASTLLAALAQRLVRLLCKECRVPYQPTALELQRLGIAPDDPRLAHATICRPGPVGCPECQGTGYRGRTGIYELLEVDDAVRQLVMAHADSGAIRREAMSNGMTTLRGDGVTKILSGRTSIEEVLRVTQEETE